MSERIFPSGNISDYSDTLKEKIDFKFLQISPPIDHVQDMVLICKASWETQDMNSLTDANQMLKCNSVIIIRTMLG